MQKLRMLVKNQWDDATLTVDTGEQVPTLPLLHSQIYGRSKTAAIIPNEAGISVMGFDCPELTLASGLVLYRHWLSNIALWRLELFSGANQSGSCVFDSALVECTPTKTLGEIDWLVDPLVSSVFDNWAHKYSQIWFAPVFFKSGRITIADTEARDGIHEFDRVYLGQVFTPTFNFSYGHAHQWLSSETQRKTSAGSTFATARQRYRQLSFSLDYLSEQDRPHLSNAIAHVGIARDWFISMFPDQSGQKEIEYAMACKFTTPPALTCTNVNNYTAPITVQEA